MSSSKFSALAVVVCLLGASFYMYEFILQVSLGVMTNELMRDLSLNAASLGIVSAFFYYAYMPMQIPAGLLHDRFGPRRILTFAILVCAFGALFFSFSYSMWLASAGRFMMGMGAAFSFSGALMLIARWFPAGYFPVMTGVVQLMSSIGAITGELPLAIAIHRWEWRPTMLYLALLGIGLACLVWLIVRDFPPGHAATPYSPGDRHRPAHQGDAIRLSRVFGRMQSWWVALYSFLIWAPIAAFAGLWGVPFLSAAYHITIANASMACAAIWIGIGFGCPFIGWLSERIRRRLVVLTTCGVLGIIGSILTIFLSCLRPFFIFPFSC
ncbi:MFS transporter [Aquicella lusitana]|uniref:Lysosomal dipeptide transporter MFSD1 n=1 Tax=Aquicella lusitana TaxID=254246 RepID=A0A370GYX4_9COXI|nr:MFS transporter [Aquicella lusitana]RDI48852.1 MFS transporter [Aquicella lusitana]VVC73280.1 putative sulfoacetate transporter SauU [Aquicella lusitana]